MQLNRLHVVEPEAQRGWLFYRSILLRGSIRHQLTSRCHTGPGQQKPTYESSMVNKSFSGQSYHPLANTILSDTTAPFAKPLKNLLWLKGSQYEESVCECVKESAMGLMR